MNKGFTLIELTTLICIVGIGLAILTAGAQGNSSTSQSDGTVCRGGYKFDRGSNKQIIGENGGGVKCDSVIISPGVR